ncbi:MAG: hypothetical protein HY668_00895 [Chloroflexi bacterium]|nr:hypothetical protein [Chloroflexota bacterium]
MLKKNAYTWAGLGLLVSGSLVFLAAYFILGAVWLMALGISMLILSFILLALGRTISGLPPEVCGLLLETGIDNIAALLEELGIKARAMYLPSSLGHGRPQALIPLHTNPALPGLRKALPRRLIVKYGDRPDDIGLLLSTVGSSAAAMLPSKPGPAAEELGEALTHLFTGVLGVADKVSVAAQGNQVKVKVHNPRIENRATWSQQSLGGPLASMVASVVAEARDKPVVIRREEPDKGAYLIEVEVIP